MIYISTGGAYSKPAWRTVEELLEADITKIELSGGLYDSENVPRLKKHISVADFKIHNYFPPPAKPFVFNLSSPNKDIRNLSLIHAKKGIDTAVELGCRDYSFHAGFLMDPCVEELGGGVINRSLIDRQEGLNIFIETVNSAAEYARVKGIELLIENNVLAAEVYNRFHDDPFLMTTAEECVYVMQNTPSNINLLIDVGHLNVSANSLSFDRASFLHECSTWIDAFHLSDNDGIADVNQKIDAHSWFWPFLKTTIKFCTIEVYETSHEDLIRQINLVEEKLIKQNDKT